ncbi:MAG TPA: HlyD family secretion protein, partial [Cyclobacteriaceae bacterium]|nr:HlyD family secretion protein [Cyclobacteriaceae bacterium]
TKMKPGQNVEIEVDAFPGETFTGKIESLSPATGAKFALLPPDNASGNFVKVVQRIPVKILLTEKAEKSNLLRAGMNVIVDVELD